MSLILDALNRAGQDQKTADAVPGLDSVPPKPSANTTPQSILLIAAAVVGLATLGVAVGWMLREHVNPDPTAALASPQTGSPDSEPREPVPPENASQPTPAVVPTRASASQPGPEIAAEDTRQDLNGAQQRAAPADVAISALYRDRDVDGAARSAAQGAPDSQGLAALSLPEQEGIPQAGPAADEAQPDERPIDVEQMLSLAQREMARAETSEHSAPLLADMPQQFKDRVPTLYYLKHDYSTNPAESRVVLNGEPYGLGDRVEAALRIQEILPDSVVLEYEGSSFRLRALSSWINL